MTGNGVQAQFSVSTETVAFGKVPRNSGSKPQTVTIKNTGTVALPITATSLGGPNEHQFSQSNDCPAESGRRQDVCVDDYFQAHPRRAEDRDLDRLGEGRRGREENIDHRYRCVGLGLTQALSSCAYRIHV